MPRHTSCPALLPPVLTVTLGPIILATLEFEDSSVYDVVIPEHEHQVGEGVVLQGRKHLLEKHILLLELRFHSAKLLKHSPFEDLVNYICDGAARLLRANSLLARKVLLTSLVLAAQL